MFNFRGTGKLLQKSEKGYSWLFFSARPSWIVSGLVTLLLIGVSSAFYLWYHFNGDDLTASGNIGLSYAIAGLTFLLLAAVSYTLRRRLHTLALGQLNRSLNWHGFFALIGLALLFMHSFGDFAPSSGVFALFSMVVLTLSGLLGRVLDRVLAWRIAVEANTILTAEGEDRVETITQEVRTLVISRKQEPARSVPRSPVPQPSPIPVIQESGSWDIAYRSLEEMPQGSKRQGQQLYPRLTGELLSVRPTTTAPAAPSPRTQMAALQEVEQAMQRQQFYRVIIQNWRKVHIALVFLTLALTLLHILIEMPYLYRALFH
jgi:hypothetical protein